MSIGTLRFLLALSVVIFHSESFLGITLLEGLAAVQIFFIVSGFYMTMVLSTRYVGTGSYKLFITNRLLRLFPSYIVVVLLTIIFSIASYIFFDNWLMLSVWVDNYNILDISTILILVFSNIFILGQDLLMFTSIDNINGLLYFTNEPTNSDIPVWITLLIPQTWSIGLELMFYIVAPFIVTRSIKTILLFISISILIRIFIYFSLGWIYDPWTYRFFPTELALFLFGSISFKIYRQIEHKNLNKIFVLFITVIYFSVIVLYQFIPEVGEIKNWLIYIYSIAMIPILFLLTKNNKVDNFIGDLSYPIYLIHILLIITAGELIHEVYKGELSVILSILCAIILVKFIERPIDKIRKKRIKNNLKKV